jgi:hypothetical protein
MFLRLLVKLATVQDFIHLYIHYFIMCTESSVRTLLLVFVLSIMAIRVSLLPHRLQGINSSKYPLKMPITNPGLKLRLHVSRKRLAGY